MTTHATMPATTLAADSMSRRAALIGAATALATPAASVAAPAGDAELLELGRQFREMEPEFKRRLAAHNKASDYARELAEARVGTSDFKGMWIEWQKTECETGAKEVAAHYHQIEAPYDELCRAILAIPAATIEGLAVKARVAVAATFNDLLGDPADLDWTDVVYRSLIENVLALAGQSWQEIEANHIDVLAS